MLSERIALGWNHHGGAFLWLVMSALFLLLSWGVSRGLWTNAARHDAQAMVESRICQLLADCAVAEAEAQVGLAVNDPSTEAFSQVRQQVVGTDQGELDLTRFVTLKDFPRIAGTSDCKGYLLDELSCRVAFQRPIDRVAYEKRGVLVVTAKVSSPSTIRRVRRRVEVARSFATTLVCVPRPFGNYGFFIVDATGLTDTDRANRMRERDLELSRQALRSLKTLRDRDSPTSRPEWDRVVESAFDPDKPETIPEPVSLPAGAVLYGLSGHVEPQPLERVDIATRLSSLIDRSESATRELARLAERGTLQPGTIQVACRLMGVVVDPLRELWRFHDTYRILTPTDAAAYHDIKKRAERLSPAFFRRRAHYILRSLPRTTVQMVFDTLTKSVTNGVIQVDNPIGQPLSLTGNLKGRMVILVGPGGVRIRDLNVAAGPADLVTVVASSGPVHVAGRCRATVVLSHSGSERPSGLEIEKDARIHGSIIALLAPSNIRWRGTLIRDDQQVSGFNGPNGKDEGLYENYFVGLSPRILYRRVVRL